MVARVLSSFSRCLMSIHRARAAAAAEPEAMATVPTVRAFMVPASGVTAGFMGRTITAAMVMDSMARATTVDTVVASIGGAMASIGGAITAHIVAVSIAEPPTDIVVASIDGAIRACFGRVESEGFSRVCQ